MRGARLRPSQLYVWAIAAIALTALLGWILDLPLLTSWAPGAPTLKPMTALSFLALVLALYAADSGHAKMTAWLGFGVAAMAALSLAQDIIGFDLGIDSWLAARLGATAPGFGSDSWRMASATAVMFMAAGAAIARLDDERRFWLVPVLAGIVGLLAAGEVIVLTIVGRELVPPPPLFISVALGTMVSFLLLAGELLWRRPLDLAALVRHAGLNLGIGGWLLALALAAALPVLLFGGIAAQRLAAAERQATLNELEQRTEATAHSVERYLKSVQELAVTFANTPALLAGELRTFHDFAQRVIAATKVARSVSLSNPDGMLLLNTRVPFGATLPSTADMQGLTETLANKSPRTTNLIAGAFGRPVFGVWAPVLRDGQVTGAIAVVVEPQDLTAVLHEERLPEGWIGTVLDRNGVIVARTNNPEKWVGQTASSRLIGARAKGQRGAYPGVTTEGIPVSSYFVNLPDLGWTMAVGVPASQLDAPASATLRFMLALGVASLSIAGGLAFLVGRHMHGQVKGVARAAMALGEGQGVTIAPSSLRELDEVAGALSSAHGIIKAREDALRAAHDSFRHLVENSPFGVYAVDADFRLVLVSAGAQKVFENVRPLIGRDFAQVLRVLWPEPFASEAIGLFRHTIETGEPYHSSSTVERRHDIGEVESYDWKIERVTLPDGRFGAVCHFYDLSERQRYEEALAASEAYSRSVFESSPDCVKILDLDGRLERMNINGQCTMEIDDFGVFCGKYWRDQWPQEAHAQMEAAMAEARAGRTGHFSGFCPTAKGTPKWWDVMVTAVPGAGGSPTRLVASSRDITARKRAEEHANLLTQEVNHRAKNLLAVVQAIARMTAGKSEPSLFAERFGARLASLAASHDLVVQSEWKGVDLSELVRSQLAHFADLIGDRIAFAGPPLQLTPPAAQAIGMAIHELATNAGKHGALSIAEGSVRIVWEILADGTQSRFEMKWSEHGGPPVAPPKRRGFGHTVIVVMAENTLDAEVFLDYAASGLVWRLEAPGERVLSSIGR